MTEAERERLRKLYLRSEIIKARGLGVDNQTIKKKLYEAGANMEDVNGELDQLNSITGTNNLTVDQTKLGNEQNKAYGFGRRTLASNAILKQLEEGIAEKGTGGAIRQSVEEFASGKNILNRFVSKEFQSFDQAQRDFINAVLRRESGAAISPEEFKSARLQYLPVPGDDQSTVEQKRRNREIITSNLLGEAGIKVTDVNALEKQLNESFGGGTTGQQALEQQPNQIDAKSNFDNIMAYAKANPNDPKSIAFMDKVNKGEIDPETGLLTKDLPEKKAEEAPISQDQVMKDEIQAGGTPEKDVGMIEKISNFIGTTKFGEGIGTALFFQSAEGKELINKAQEGDQTAVDTLKEIIDNTPNSKEILGSAGLTALNIITAGGASRTVQGAKFAGKLLAKGAVGQVVKGAGKKILKDIGIGTLFGVAGGAEQNKDTEGIIKQGESGAVVSGTLGTAGVVGSKVFSSFTKGLPKLLYNTAIKTDLKDTKKAITFGGKTLGEELLDRGMAGSDKSLFRKAAENINKSEDKLQSILKKSKETITRKEIAPAFEGIKKTIKETPGLDDASKVVDKIIKQFPKSATLAEANQIKRNIYSALTDTAFKLDPSLSTNKKVMKLMASKIKTLIEQKTEGSAVKELNKDLAVNIKLRDNLTDKFARGNKNRLLGLTDVIVGGGAAVGGFGSSVGAIALKKLAETTAFKTNTAKALYNLGKSIDKLPTDKAGNISRTALLDLFNQLNKD